MDFENAADADTDNTYKFNVVYTQGANVFTDAVELKVTDSTPPTSNTTAANTVLTVEEAQDIVLNTTGTNGILSAKFQEFAEADKTGAAYNGGFTLTAAAAGDAGDVAHFTISATGVISLAAGSDLDFEAPVDGSTDNSYKFNVVYTDSNSVTFTEAVTLNVTDDATSDTATSWATTVASEVASEGKVTIAANNDNTNAGAFDPANVAGDLALMSTDAQAFITAAGGVGNIAFATTHANANTSGAAGVLAMPTTAANVQGVATMVLTSSGGSNSGSSFKEVITFDITGSAPNSNNISKSADLATKSLTTFTGGTSGGEANSVDLDDAANNAKFADLHAFRTAHTGGAYALTVGSADFTLDSDNVLSLKEGKAAGTYTATVTYTSGSDVFTQQLSITTTAAAVGAASKTASQTSTADTSAATRTSTEVTSGKSSVLINEARSGTIKSVGTGAVLSAAFDTFVTAHANGTFTLEGTDAALFSVDKNTGDVTSKGLVDYENKTSYEFTVKYTEGTNIYSEAVSLAVTDDPADGGTHLADVDLSTANGAASSVLILDKALAQISSSQAKLGAIQNRLQHNIDNLSMASMLTETARGRVVDADFARETSELSKQQILGQAATSMLAQANQSKQSVLALLQ